MSRWLILLLAALLTLLAAAPANAPSATSDQAEPGAQNCVRASSSAAPAHAEADRPGSSCTHPGSVAAKPRTATGCCVATKGLTGIDDALDAATTVRGKFAPTADPGAVLLRRDPVTGAPTHYQVYGPDGLPVKRVDLTGRAHGGVPTPHVVEYQRNVNPETGETFVRPNRHVRPADPDEIPGG